jgi:hypothetical protein
LRALLCGSGRVSTFELTTLEFLPSSRRQWRRQQRRRQLRRRQQPSADGEPTEGFSDGACGYFVGFGDWTRYGYVIGFVDGTCGYVIGFSDATCGYVTVGFGDRTYYGYAIGFGDGAFSSVIGFTNRATATTLAADDAGNDSDGSLAAWVEAGNFRFPTPPLQDARACGMRLRCQRPL